MKTNVHDLPTTGAMMDFRGTPVHQCVCGCSMFKVLVSFEDYEISTYSLDGECVDCASRLTMPTPLDRI